MAKFLTVCLNPVLQKTLLFNNFAVGKVNRTERYYYDASGKGVNVSRALKQLGAEDVTHLTHAGTFNRKVFTKLAKNDGFKLKTIRAEAPIRSCLTIVDCNNFTTTELVEESKHINEKCELKLLKYYYNNISKFDYLIISGSKAPGYSSSIIPQMVKAAKDSGVVTILDIKGEDLKNSLTFKPDFIKHNLEEFHDTFGNLEKLSDLESCIIITDGSNPVRFNCGNGIEFEDVDSNIIPVNTTGCGDTFTAAFALSISNGDTVKKAIKSATVYATISATTNRPAYIKD